jgi:hypothetical protein
MFGEMVAASCCNFRAEDGNYALQDGCSFEQMVGHAPYYRDLSRLRNIRVVPMIALTVGLSSQGDVVSVFISFSEA